MMTKQEIKKEILKEALNYLKNKKAYDENPCETSENLVLKLSLQVLLEIRLQS